MANFRPNEDDYSSELENSPVHRGVILEVYEQKKSKGLCTTTTIEPRSSASSTLNFNFDFDNWSLDELPQMDDGKFSDRIQHALSNDLGPEVLVLTPPSPPAEESDDIEEQDQFGGDVKDHGLELNSMIESMKELTLLDRFKGMIRKNSTNMFKRLNSSSFDLALFEQGGDGIIEDGSTRILPSSALAIAPSPTKIKFEEYVASEFEQGQAHTMPSASTCTPTPITPNNYHPTRKHKRHRHSHHHHHHHHHSRHQKCTRAQLSTPSSSSTTSPKRKKSFLHFRSASLPFNLFDFKLAATSSCSCTSSAKHSSASFILNHPPKLILKCKVNQNYNQESIESIKQDLMQFDEFWRKFEMMEQAKNNYSNDDLLNSMRLEQVRNYYYDN